MSVVRHTNFSLLTQQEIDTLVKFLTNKKNQVDSDVMSQNSIDKLIRLIQTDKERLALDSSLSYGDIDTTLLKKLHFRSSLDEICELRCQINSESGFIELIVYNHSSKESISLTPKILDENDTDQWGYAIPPSLFNHIAQAMLLKYTTQTHDMVCNIFAKHNYGSEDHKIPEMFLPENSALLDCLL